MRLAISDSPLAPFTRYRSATPLVFDFPNGGVPLGRSPLNLYQKVMAKSLLFFYGRLQLCFAAKKK